MVERTLKGKRATLADVEAELGPQSTWGAAAARVAARNAGTGEVLIFRSTEPYSPDATVRLARGLGQHFPKARVSIDTTGGQVRVFAKESDRKRIELMRAFCAGFAASR